MELSEELEHQELLQRRPLSEQTLLSLYGPHPLILQLLALVELHYVDKLIKRPLMEHRLKLRGLNLLFEEASLDKQPQLSTDPFFTGLPQLPQLTSQSQPQSCLRQIWTFSKHPKPHSPLLESHLPSPPGQPPKPPESSEKYDQDNLIRMEDCLCLALTPSTFYFC